MALNNTRRKAYLKGTFPGVALRYMAFTAALWACTALAGSAWAQTVLINPIAVTSSNFTYGNLSFAITSCSFTYAGGSTSCGSDGSELEGISNGRGGTEIELLSPSGSYAQTAGQANTTLSFGLTVTDLTGSRGLSSVSNILSASVNNSADNALVSSVLSGFNVSASPSSVTSNAGTLSTSTSFALTRSPVSFNVSINLDSSGAKSGDTLTLNNLKILFQPAPEPASIAVFLSALGALATCRRRLRRSGMTPSGKLWTVWKEFNRAA